MTTYLLTWNPSEWDWKELPTLAVNTRAGSVVERRWSCSRSKKLNTGDRIFLMRVGVEPKGITGSGFITEKSYEGPHWNHAKAKAGKTCRFVEVRFDTLLNPLTDTILTLAKLRSPPLVTKRWTPPHWTPESSGNRVPEDIAIALEEAWLDHVQGESIVFPDEISAPSELYEGAVTRVTVNAYERDPEARRQCLAHYRPICVVCQLDFTAQYGPIAQGRIHVHHLVPQSARRRRYRINPIRDLRPVCPNCHMVIHLRSPEPYTIKEVQAFLAIARKNQTSNQELPDDFEINKDYYLHGTPKKHPRKGRWLPSNRLRREITVLEMKRVNAKLDELSMSIGSEMP